MNYSLLLVMQSFLTLFLCYVVIKNHFLFVKNIVNVAIVVSVIKIITIIKYDLSLLMVTITLVH